tara:strand:- start:280 stop:1005 length:726 start_codon:yes stop_codon:yes gene_type:complete
MASLTNEKRRGFPLPVSKNTHIHGVVVRKGLFASYAIVWAGEFLKQAEPPTDRHVFILQHLEEKDFLFVYWRSAENEPRVLTPEHYEACFDRAKSVSPSNRYLFHLNDRYLLLPYAPVDLFERWNEGLLLRNADNVDHSFLCGLFEAHFASPIPFRKERARVKRFCGWYSSYEDLPIDEYRRLFLSVDLKREGHQIDISRAPSELTREQQLKVKEAFRIVRSIFKNLILEESQEGAEVQKA